MNDWHFDQIADALLRSSEHNGFPVVVSRESLYLVGFVLRRDLNLAIGKFMKHFFHIVDFWLIDCTKKEVKRVQKFHLGVENLVLYRIRGIQSHLVTMPIILEKSEI